MMNIYEYTNYRVFLKDFLAEKKRSKRPEFSHKVILDRMGISSTGFLSNVISGRKNLTPIQISRLCRILKLNKIEESYFEAMVHFTQAKAIDEKGEYFDRMIFVQKANLKVLDRKKMTLFSKWYYVFIREALNYIHYKDDPASLARMLDPPVKPSEAQEAISFLEQLELIVRDSGGFCKQADPAITSGDEARSLDLARFQLTTMDLAKRALQKIPPEDRDISVLTMTLSPDSFRLIKSELQSIRKKFAKIAIDDTNSDRVYQLNMQFFPVTRKLGDQNENK
jgi:uncharacterized protein (TIGR02147 family)